MTHHCEFCRVLIGLGDGRTSRARRDGEGRGEAFRLWHHEHCVIGPEHGCSFPWLKHYNPDTKQMEPSCYDRFDALYAPPAELPL